MPTRHALVLYSYCSRHRRQTLCQQVQGSHHIQNTISHISPSTHTTVAPEDSPGTRHHALDKKSTLQRHRKTGPDASHPLACYATTNNINTRYANYTAAPSGRRGSTLSQDDRTLPILVYAAAPPPPQNQNQTHPPTILAALVGVTACPEINSSHNDGGTCIVRYRCFCVSSKHKLSTHRRSSPAPSRWKPAPGSR